MTETAAIPPSITVKAGHVQPLWAGHPWVFKQAIQRIDEGIATGDEVVVIDPHGKILGRGLYSAGSAIAVRIFTGSGGQGVDAALIKQRMHEAAALRRAHGLPCDGDRATTGYRLVHGEGDGLPGLIVDVFEKHVVVQLGTAGLKRHEEAVVEALRELLGDVAVIDRTPPEIAKTEGFEASKEPRALAGEVPDTLSFSERGLRFELPMALGQKTGFYFDQRPLRERIEALASGQRVLDACCYVGPIALSAARGGASEVWAIDKSVPAIEVGKHCAGLNGASDKVRFEAIDSATAFRSAAEADSGGFDIVICDPPKLATKRRGRDKAFGGYRKLAAGAVQAVKPGGLLAFCSCSASVSMEALTRCLALGARDASRRARIVERLFQGADHPVHAAFPEGLYLKVLLARIDEA